MKYKIKVIQRSTADALEKAAGEWLNEVDITIQHLVATSSATGAVTITIFYTEK